MHSQQGPTRVKRSAMQNSRAVNNDDMPDVDSSTQQREHGHHQEPPTISEEAPAEEAAGLEKAAPAGGQQPAAVSPVDSAGGISREDAISHANNDVTSDNNNVDSENGRPSTPDKVVSDGNVPYSEGCGTPGSSSTTGSGNGSVGEYDTGSVAHPGGAAGGSATQQCLEGREMDKLLNKIFQRRSCLEESAMALQKSLDVAEKKSKDAVGRVANEEKNLQAVRNEIDRYEKEAREMTAELEKAEHAKKELERQLQVISFEVEQAKANARAAKKQEDQLRQLCQEAEQDLAEMVKETAAAKEELKKTTAERDKFCEQAEKLRETLNLQKSQLRDAIMAAVS